MRCLLVILFLGISHNVLARELVSLFALVIVLELEITSYFHQLISTIILRSTWTWNQGC